MSARSEYSLVQRATSDELVREHTPLVRRIAYHLMARLPANVDVHDLMQSGMVGLLEAAKSYTCGRSASFETFAGSRIRGAMLDELRRSDWAPRSVRRKVREMATAMREVERETGGSASKSDVMRQMGIDGREYDRIVMDAVSVRVLPLTVGGEDPEPAAPGEHGPPSKLEEARLREALAAAIAGLPERERTVVALYYDEELNLREIGAVLGVSESRVCQIHGQAITRLRARMDAWRTST